jgi:RIO kinase 1
VAKASSDDERSDDERREDERSDNDTSDHETRKLSERILHSERDSRYLRKDSDQRKVMEEVFDRATLVSVEELFRRGQLAQLNGVVNSGKEARVYYGLDPEGSPVAVKIYMTVSADFRRRVRYITGDRRFGKLPSNSRETINLWVRKEYKNLELADSSGVRVPKPLYFFKNILLMEYIGEPPRPAPTFAETEVNQGDCRWTFATVKKLYRSAGLVHADLSEYNIFKHGSERVFFDLGAAVLSSHPEALDFLRRDLTNVVRFFKKRGLLTEDVQTWMGRIVK